MQAIYQVRDDRFDIADLEHKKLILEFQVNKFVFTIFNTKNNTLEWLEDFPIHNWESNLKDIFDSHQFLKANFWNQIGVVFHSKQKAIVPQKFIGENNLKEFILDFETKEESPVFKAFMINTESSLVYHVPRLFLDFLVETYQNRVIEIIPMEVCQAQQAKTQSLHLNKNWINFSRIGINGIEDSKLIEIKSRQHLSKCLAYFAREGFDINLLGEITNYSSTYELVVQSKEKVKFGLLSSSVRLSQFFADVPKHKYFTIFNSIKYF